MKLESYVSLGFLFAFVAIGAIRLIIDSRKLIKRKRVSKEALARKNRGRSFVECELPENNDKL